jgi:L-threonylcarbamoyladenylate synthase
MLTDSNNIINIEENLDSALVLAMNLYHSGNIFIYPTDTIYGIGGNPFDQKVVKKISGIKGRDEKKQFIWLVYNFENLLNYVEIIYENHLDFLQAIWPGPVSVVLNLNERINKLTNLETVAVRIPANNFCEILLGEIKQPLISTSVNRSGQTPVNQLEEFTSKFADEVDAIFFNSAPISNISSTIIDLTSDQPKLIREGSIKFVELLKKFN